MQRIMLGLVAFALLIAACGGDGEGATTTAAAAETTSTMAATTTTAAETVTIDEGFPVTISTGGGEVTIEERPERIVSLSATATESLFAIGAGDQVVAVDDTSNYPAEAPVTDLNGFTATAESIAAYDADLVVYFYDPGDLAAGLAALGVPALFQPAAVDLDDALAQIEQLGAATGHIADAAALVAEMAVEIEEQVEAAADAGELTYYYELDESLYSLTSETFVGKLFAPLGLVNIADPADPDGFGYPQLSAEFILDEDPAVIFLADTRCCGQTAATVAARPGWDSLTAGQTGGVVELDDDVASRWGPRIVDLVAAASEAVRTVASANA